MIAATLLLAIQDPAALDAALRRLPAGRLADSGIAVLDLGAWRTNADARDRLQHVGMEAQGLVDGAFSGFRAEEIGRATAILHAPYDNGDAAYVLFGPFRAADPPAPAGALEEAEVIDMTWGRAHRWGKDLYVTGDGWEIWVRDDSGAPPCHAEALATWRQGAPSLAGSATITRLLGRTAGAMWVQCADPQGAREQGSQQGLAGLEGFAVAVFPLSERLRMRMDSAFEDAAAAARAEPTLRELLAGDAPPGFDRARVAAEDAFVVVTWEGPGVDPETECQHRLLQLYTAMAALRRDTFPAGLWPWGENYAARPPGRGREWIRVVPDARLLVCPAVGRAAYLGPIVDPNELSDDDPLIVCPAANHGGTAMIVTVGGQVRTITPDELEALHWREKVGE